MKKYLLILIVTCFFTSILIAAPQAKDDEVVAFSIVDKKPMFQDKEASAFRDWIYEQIKEQGYPAAAVEKKIQGTVYLSFIVNTDGTLSDIKSLRKVNSILSEAAINIVKKSPKWNSAEHKNKTVKVPYQVPIVFKLAN